MTAKTKDVPAMLLSNHTGEAWVSIAKQCIRRLTVVLLGLGLAALSIASSAQAQDSGWTPNVGLAVGTTAVPQSNSLGGVDVGGGLNPGFTVAGSVGFGPARSPVSYRVEVQYAHLGLDDEGRFGAGGAPVVASGNANILSGTGNVLLHVFPTKRFRPYLIGGAGVYRLSSNVDYATPEGKFIRYLSVPTDGKTRLGLNGGAGLEVAFGAVRGFAEARFHRVLSRADGTNLIPISFGMRF